MFELLNPNAENFTPKTSEFALLPRSTYFLFLGKGILLNRFLMCSCVWILKSKHLGLEIKNRMLSRIKYKIKYIPNNIDILKLKI